MTETQLLDDVPEFLSIESMFKAIPAEESGKRFIYFEASNEKVDQQNERVMAKALEESADHYKKFGNVDIDHYSLIGKPNPRTGYVGIPNAELYEIGRPTEVRIEARRTFVKAQLYSGDTDLAKNANMVWDSMTSLNPPARWYPSVGGAVLAKSVQIDPETKNKIAVVEKVRWTNVALSRTPVNQNLPTAQVVPFGALAKCWGPAGLMLSKALEAGTSTNVATLTGGAALGTQSLDMGRRIKNYEEFRDELIKADKAGRIDPNAGLEGVISYSSRHFGLPLDEASEYTARFVRDLQHGLKQRSKS
ncbi:hypothetical protein [Paraburkholderia phenoliruptrix]|uniref:hypothetical protein n=1 Tax=Paraburkholderia phenoliruptrix TaxID=252970 RepID=UPI0034CE31BD